MDSLGRRVVITGIGLINPLGNNSKDIWAKFLSGEVGLTATPENLLAEIGSPVCGCVENLNPGQILKNKKTAKLMGRDSLLGIKAAGDALTDANWQTIPGIEQTMGLYVSTGLTYGAKSDIFPLVTDAITEEGFSMALFGTQSLSKCNPLLSFKILPNMPACHISIELGLIGPNMVFNPWPVQGALALNEAFLAISKGYMEHALVGSTESRLHFAGVQTTEDYGTIYKGSLPAAKASKPLHPDRYGIVPAEGAAFICLESLESAVHRKQPIYGEILGFGQSNSFSDDTDSSCQAICEAIAHTIHAAKINIADINLVSASAASSPALDSPEGMALEKGLGRHTPVWAPKAYYGELGAASFITSLAIGALTLQNSVLPPTLNMEQCAFNIKRLDNKPFKSAFNNCLVTAFEVGMTKASVLLGRVEN